MSDTTVVLVTAVVILSAVVWFDRRCLADLPRPVIGNCATSIGTSGR